MYSPPVPVASFPAMMPATCVPWPTWSGALGLWAVTLTADETGDQLAHHADTGLLHDHAHGLVRLRLRAVLEDRMDAQRWCQRHQARMAGLGPAKDGRE